MCRMESVEFEGNILEEGHINVIDSRCSSPNLQSPNRPIKFSSKISTVQRKPDRFRINVSLEEDEKEESDNIEDLNIRSLKNNLILHQESCPWNDKNEGSSPKNIIKTKRTPNINQRQPEVEFSFKPGSFSKGSQRYTSEGENFIDMRESSREFIKNSTFDQAGFSGFDDKFQPFTNINIVKRQHSPSSNYHERLGTSSSKSSIVCNRSSPKMKAFTREINFGIGEEPCLQSPTFLKGTTTQFNIIAPRNSNHLTSFQSDYKNKHISTPTSGEPKIAIRSPSICSISSSRQINRLSKEIQEITPKVFTPVTHTANSSLTKTQRTAGIPAKKHRHISGGFMLDEGMKENIPGYANRSNYTIELSTADKVKSPHGFGQEGFFSRKHSAQVSHRSSKSFSNTLSSHQPSPFPKEINNKSSLAKVINNLEIFKKKEPPKINQVQYLKGETKNIRYNSKTRPLGNRDAKLKPRCESSFKERPQESFQIDDSRAKIERRKHSLVEDLNLKTHKGVKAREDHSKGLEGVGEKRNPSQKNRIVAGSKESRVNMLAFELKNKLKKHCGNNDLSLKTPEYTVSSRVSVKREDGLYQSPSDITPFTKPWLEERQIESAKNANKTEIAYRPRSQQESVEKNVSMFRFEKNGTQLENWKYTDRYHSNL